MDEIEILAKAELWYEENQHQKIIDLIESLPKEEQSPALLSELGRAYNNLYWLDENDNQIYLEKALETLKRAELSLKEDLSWNYRIGYSYFYLNEDDKAKFHFNKFKEMGGEEDDFHLNIIKISDEKGISLSEALNEYLEEDSDIEPEFFYDEKEIELLENFIENKFGEIDSVFHELVSPDIHCDIYVIKPSKERNYYSLVTGGMGAYRMNVPDGFDAIQRAELIINLPPDWEIKNEDEKWYWPLRWLKILARLPIEQNTFLGWGHTIPTGEDLTGTDFNCLLLVGAKDVEFNDAIMELPNKELVAFYNIVPLYPEETQFKLDHDADGLLEKFDEFDIPYPPIVDVNRVNACEYYEPQAQSYLLDNVQWKFNHKVYKSLMNFVVELKAYNEEMGNELSDFNPFATIFDNKHVRVIYDAFIQSKEDLLNYEILLNEEETFQQEPVNGLYPARMLATLTSEQENSFSSSYLFYQIHNTLTNKEIGENVYFEGFEILGYEEDGVPVIALQLKS